MLGGGLALLAGLASCENFMKGSAVKDQLSDAIEIANSQAITYFVSVDKGSGEVTPASVSVKKKENFELIFTPEEDWQFICWETIDAQTGKVVPDVIKFENPQKTQTKAYVINPKEKVLIHPKCVQLPAVVSVEPQNANYVNIPIVIKFNIPVEALECEQKDSQFNYTNISLTCNGKEVDDYFEAPVFNEDKTELTLKPIIVDVDEDHPDSVLLKTYIDKLKLGAAYIDISFSENIKIVSGENSYSLKDAGNAVYSVRYVPVIENTPPLKHEFIIGRNPDILKENKNYTGEAFHKQKIQDKPADMDNDTYYDLVLQNACNGKIYIYGSYFDDESGVKSVVIKERFIKDMSGTSVTTKFATTEYDISSSFFISENGETQFFIPYEIVSYIYYTENYIEEEGTLSLQVYVMDECKNAAEVEEFVIIKRNSSANIYAFFNEKDYKPVDISNYWEDFDTYLTSYKNYCTHLWLESDEDVRPLNSIALLKEDAYEINVEYIDNHNKPQTVNANFEIYQTYKLRRLLEINDLGFIPGASIIVNVEDVLNNFNTFNLFTFPQKDMKIHIIKQNQNTVKFYNTEGKSLSPVLIRQSKQNPNSAKECSKKYEIQSGYIYQIMLDGIILDTTFEYDDLDSFIAADSNDADKVEITDISIKPSTKAGYYTATIKIAEDSWNKFQVIYYYESNNGRKEAFKFGSTELSLDFETETLYSWDRTIEIYGFSGNNWSYTTGTIPRKTEEDSDFLDFDNVAPQYYHLFTILGDDLELSLNSFSDVGSGIKQGSLIIQNSDPKINKTYELDFVNAQSLKIPMWEWQPSTENPSDVIISVYDNAGNSSYEVHNMYADYYPMFTELEKQKNESDQFTGNLNLSFVWYGSGDIYGYKFQDVGTNNISGNIGFEHNLEYYAKQFDPDTSSEKIGHSIYKYILTINKDELDSITDEHPYVKLIKYDITGNGSYSVPRYYYNGTPGNKETDFIIPNGSNNDSMLIGSDKPVFVHTIATSVSLDKCKNWDYSEWEFYKQEYGEQILDCGVSITQNGSPVDIATTKIYQIPTDKIEKGQNYIVIAHYSNDNVLMSPIMTK